MRVIAALVLAFSALVTAKVPTKPDQAYTKGCLCQPTDPHFLGYYYPARVPKCDRYVTTTEKNTVAAHYGLLSTEYSLVEFDHLIPLGIGGCNDATNIFPQAGPTGQGLAGAKDVIEQQAYDYLVNGGNQKTAVKMIFDWLNKNYGTTYNVAAFFP